MTDEFYNAFERFCIVSDSEGDITAYEVTRKEFGAGIAGMIWSKYYKKERNDESAV